MTDRIVKTTLLLQATGYIQGMDQAARKTRDLGSEAEKLAQKRQSLEVLGRGLLAVGLAAAAGVGLAVAKYAEFDQAMSQVNAITQETTANQNLLRDAALDAGGATVFTAREAANAEEELAKAGLGASYILGGALTGSLSLAASGQLEVARAAEITGVTLKQFGMDGSQAARVADVLSAGANKAVGSVEDLAQGLKFVGPVSNSMNVSLEDTVATLALFADNGILGEQAGTSLRGVLSSLTSPSKAANDELKRLNVTLYDGNGKFLGLENATGELNRALGSATDAERDMSLGLIFGNQQVTAARVLVGAGAQTWREYRDDVEDAGIAQRIASERMDNLSGDVEKLGGAFDTALIKSGSSANDVLRATVQAVTFLVDGVGNLPEPVLGAGLAIGVVAAAVGLAGGAALLAVPKFAAFKVAMDDLKVSGKQVAVGVGGVGTAIAIATLLIGAFIAKQADSKAASDSFADSLNQTTGAVTNYTRELVAKRLDEKGAFDTATRFGVSQQELTTAILKGGAALDVVNKKLYENRAAMGGNRGTGTQDGYRQLVQVLSEVNGELDQSRSSFENTKAATETAAVSYQEAADNVAALQSNLDQLIETINKANGVGQDAVTTNASYQAALADVADTIAQAQAGVDGFSTSVDESTASGSANADMFADLAKKSQDAAQAQLELDGSTERYVANLNAGRQTLYDQILALTGNADAAQALTDKIYAIPDQKQIDVIVDTVPAETKLKALYDWWNGKSIEFKVATSYAYNSGSVGGIPTGYAFGGYTGDGGKFDVAGPVHKKEWVSTAETVAKPANRAALEYMHSGGDMAKWSAAAPSQGMWLAAPPMASAQASRAGVFAPEFKVILQSKGGVDLTQYIEARIEMADQSKAIDNYAGGPA